MSYICSSYCLKVARLKQKILRALEREGKSPSTLFIAWEKSFYSAAFKSIKAVK